MRSLGGGGFKGLSDQMSALTLCGATCTLVYFPKG